VSLYNATSLSIANRTITGKKARKNTPKAEVPATEPATLNQEKYVTMR